MARRSVFELPLLMRLFVFGGLLSLLKPGDKPVTFILRKMIENIPVMINRSRNNIFSGSV